MNRAILGFIRKELIQNLRDPRMRALIFILPAIQLTVFGLAIRTEMRNIRLAVSGNPDPVFRAVEDRAFASKWVIPASVHGNDPYLWVKSGEAEVVLSAPAEGLGRSIKRGRGRLQILIDATDTVRARSIDAYLSTIIAQAVGEVSPRFRFSIRTLYNPELKTSDFMVPSITGMILSIITIILTSMSLAREKELGTMETLLSAPLERWEILIGKTIPFVLIGMIVFGLISSVGIFGFGVPERGPAWMLVLAGLVFVSTTTIIGILISTLADNQQQAMMAGFIFLFPALQLSGIMFPLDNMPLSISWISYFNPLRYFVILLRNIMLKGGDPVVFSENITALAMLGVSCAVVAVKRFHETLN